jgi:hypothetical protein
MPELFSNSSAANQFAQTVSLAHFQFERDTIAERLGKGREHAKQREKAKKHVSQNGLGKVGGPKSTLEKMSPRVRKTTCGKIKMMVKQRMPLRDIAGYLAAATKGKVDHKTVAAMIKEIKAKRW